MKSKSTKLKPKVLSIQYECPSSVVARTEEGLFLLCYFELGVDLKAASASLVSLSEKKTINLQFLIGLNACRQVGDYSTCITYSLPLLTYCNTFFRHRFFVYELTVTPSCFCMTYSTSFKFYTNRVCATTPCKKISSSRLVDRLCLLPMPLDIALR